mmetsp:Transcript_65446/g.176059  ORF Transcript_65446/g.176059 Transcript_65446/m.176059 type:complete len:353 (+) Transcript_65446:234-1292(+)
MPRRPCSSHKKFPSHSFTFCRSNSPAMVMVTVPTLSPCLACNFRFSSSCCSQIWQSPWPLASCEWPWPWPCSPAPTPASSRSCEASSEAACSMSKAPTPMIASKATLEYSACCKGASGLMLRTRCKSFSRSPAGTRSVLFIMIRSANAICRAHSLASPGFFSSSRCCMQYLLSTTVTIASNCKALSNASSNQKMDASGPGSAKPVVSMRMLSKPSRLTRTSSAETKSSRTEQQTQPLASSTQSAKTSPFGPVTPVVPGASMPDSAASSFWITAILFPWSPLKMCLSSVVLPLPKNPVTIVTGVGAFASFASPSSTSIPQRRPARTRSRVPVPESRQLPPPMGVHVGELEMGA